MNTRVGSFLESTGGTLEIPEYESCSLRHWQALVKYRKTLFVS